ncbi:MAG TPA: response regulator transcription factor [Gemmatimonadales bacterium]|jgi:two-component system LytT family response regulator
MTTASDLDLQRMSALIVDDEAPARRRLLGVLKQIPMICSIEECSTGGAAVATLRRRLPDLLFLDVRMPDISGFEVLARFPAHQQPAVIFVTAFEEYAAKAFAIHAFDYLLKPFDDERVIEAVRRAAAFLEWLRRGAAQIPDRFGDVRVDLETHQVYRANVPVTLRPKESALLMALLRARGRVVTRIELLRQVWGYADEAETRTVDTHIARLRLRLEADPSCPVHILTVRSVGYRIDFQR